MGRYHYHRNGEEKNLLRTITRRHGHRTPYNVREDAAAATAIQCAQRERAHLLAMRRLADCPGAADMVERARLAARARRATVVGLEDQVRDSRRAAGMANHDALRVAHEEVQREGQEFLERSKAAARAWRASALARRRGTRVEYEKRVQLLLTGVTPPRRSRVRAAAAEAAANSGPIGTTGIHSGAEGTSLAQMLDRRSLLPQASPINGLC